MEPKVCKLVLSIFIVYCNEIGNVLDVVVLTSEILRSSVAENAASNVLRVAIGTKETKVSSEISLTSSLDGLNIEMLSNVIYSVEEQLIFGI